MNEKLKQIGIPFILMLIFNLGIFYLTCGQNFKEGLSPHVGILLISGLLFGPYGAIGSVAANIICDLIKGYSPASALLSAIVSLAVSYLAYKLWYNKYKRRAKVTNPKLNNTTNVLLFICITLFCGALYAILHGKLFYLLYPNTPLINNIIEFKYFLNFVNSSIVFGIIGIWLSNKTNFIHVPKPTKRQANEKLYMTLGILLISALILTLIIDCCIVLNNDIITVEFMIVTLILFAYLTKPIGVNVDLMDSKSIPEEIMNIFHLTILFIIIIGIVISYDHTLITAIQEAFPLDPGEIVVNEMVLMDILLLIFFIPSFSVLKYVEIKVINPILSFSRIEDFIHENEKIESDKLVDLYSKYVSEETEIGTLARSYTDLINFNNSYIENIREIEGEKERINAELDIATRIQASSLPTEAIENDDFIVNGYSQPAREVGGDFFDYYMIDEDNLAIAIGDASGKGVPAAIVAMITQVTIKHILKQTQDPSKVLRLLNNDLCENNHESMFITLWLGIYNRTSKKLTFSNAGHNSPLIKENSGFEYMDIDFGIGLGIIDDFDYVKEESTLESELILYTDGITDANNKDDKRYGKDRLLNFFNGFECDTNPIMPLLNDIHSFTENMEQYDDMTLLYLKIKDD